jgi:GTPase
MSINKRLTVDQYLEGILDQDRVVLSQAITLLESELPSDKSLAGELINRCLPYTGNSFRIGITGVPGVGKSTFIETFGLKLIEQDKKPAVLAIDPSSSVHKGSILADKTRMNELSKRPEAFIRPSPAGQNLGGVARKTRETVYLCEAAGFDTIIIETVGVGQSGTSVASMVDFFMLLMLANAGDELQGIKRGIMEMADAIIINKADGNQIEPAKMAMLQYRNALQLFPPKPNQWKTDVLTCSALNGYNFDQVFETLVRFKKQAGNERILQNRREQNVFWMLETIEQLLKDRFYQSSVYLNQIETLKTKVSRAELNAFDAAAKLIEDFWKELKENNN